MSSDTVRASAAMLGRLLMAALFVLEGWSKIRGYAPAAAYMEGYSVPGALLPLVIASGPDRVSEERLGAQIKVVCGKISGERFLDRRLFARRNFGLKLVGDRLGNLALNGEHVR